MTKGRPPTNRAAPEARVAPTSLQKILLVAGSLLVGLLIIELVVRVLGFAPDVALIERGRYRVSSNSKIGYEPMPRFDYRDEDLEFYDFRGRSNSLGFRDYEHPPGETPGSVPDHRPGRQRRGRSEDPRLQETYPALLEGRLRDLALNAEVMSFSVSGYNTQQEVETLKVKGLRYDPDLVVLAYTLNDANPVADLLHALLDQAGDGNRLGLTRFNPYLVKSALYRTVRYRVIPALTGRDESVRAEDYANLSGDTVEPSFRELARMARRNEVEVLVAIFPAFYDLGTYAFHEVHDVVESLARENSLDSIDLLPHFLQCRIESRELLAFDNFHPTEYGHLCAARATASHINEIAGSSR